MRQTTIARNYAEALLELARRDGDALDAYGALLADLAGAVGRDPKLRQFLESPKVDEARKAEIVGKALQARAPRNFVRFVQAVIGHRRQMLIPMIATEYQALVDEVAGRVHAQVTVARETGDGERQLIAQQLSRALGKTVVPHLQVDPAILGGIVVKVGDTVMDGSVRRRLARLRHQLA